MRTVIKVLGTLVFLYGAAAPFVAMKFPVQMSVQWYSQVIGAIVVGSLMIGWEYIPNLRNFLPKSIKTQQVGELTPDQLEDQDIKYIYYLTRRAISYNDEESVSLCRNLADRFFEAHHRHEIPTNSTPSTTAK